MWSGWQCCQGGHGGVRVVQAVKKWSPFCFQASKVLNFGTQSWTLSEAVSESPKMGLGMPEIKNGDHFFILTSPTNGGIDINLMRLSLLGVFEANYETKLIPKSLLLFSIKLDR